MMRSWNYKNLEKLDGPGQIQCTRIVMGTGYVKCNFAVLCIRMKEFLYCDGFADLLCYTELKL